MVTEKSQQDNKVYALAKKMRFVQTPQKHLNRVLNLISSVKNNNYAILQSCLVLHLACKAVSHRLISA